MSKTVNNLLRETAKTLCNVSQEAFFTELKRAHAHELIAVSCNYKSKSSMQADTSENIKDRMPQGLDANNIMPSMVERAKKLSGFERSEDDVYMRTLAQSVCQGIDSNAGYKCFCCGDESCQLEDIQDPSEDESTQFACASCVNSELNEPDGDIAECRFCGSGIYYHVNDINANGECPEHEGESQPLDEDEEDDWGSYSEYLENH